MESYIGCSGWYYRGWKGLFYPSDLKSSQWFSYYQSIFNAVEINSTFYRMPQIKNVKRWLYRLRPGFSFVVKAHRSITHLGHPDLMETFYEGLQPVFPHLKAILLQFPPSFKFNVKKLNDFFRFLKPNLVHAVEFRAMDWFENLESLIPDFPNNIVPVSVSAPIKSGFPESLFVANRKAYIRFHGRTAWYRHDYTDDELRSWIKQIRQADLNLLFAFFNNDVHASAPRNALKFLQLLASEE